MLEIPSTRRFGREWMLRYFAYLWLLTSWTFFYFFCLEGRLTICMCIADAGYTSRGVGGEIILKMSEVIFCESVQTYLFIVITRAENSKTKLKFKKT